MYKHHFANSLSISRILLTPLIIFCFVNKLTGFEYLAALIFFLASLTDFFDGFVARKLNSESELGAVLDLIADKILVLVTLFYITDTYSDFLITFLCSLILIREIIILSLRSIYSQKKAEVIYIGKIKTFLQMFAIILLLVIDSPSDEFHLFMIAKSVLFLSAIISYISLYFYVVRVK